MKKITCTVLLIASLILQAMPIVSFGAEKTVTANLPAFRVQINGTVVESPVAEYPLLVYKDITYMPMTYSYCNLIGLESSWTQEDGLKVAILKSGEIPTITETKTDKKHPSKVTASIIETPVTINGKLIDNSKEPYPLLRYQDITYFPLTFQFTKEEFNIYNNFNADTGLQIYSENKFFYQYYPPGSQTQYTDFRVSNILYEMAAVTIANGKEQYPSNNVALYESQQCGVPSYPAYDGQKYYGYLPDGNGGLKVNTDSKLTPFGFETTVITDLQNPVAAQVKLF